MILRTKLRPTFVSPHLVARTRLLERLGRAGSARLVVVHSEAGAGKSSLLFDFIRQSGQPCAWYSLDEEDAAPGIFVPYLVHALASAYPGAVARTLERLARSPQPEEGWMALLAFLVDELVDFPDCLRLVLDDYHLVDGSAEVRDAVQFLLLRGPTSLQLLLTTRTVPDLPLARLRAKRMLHEVGTDDLRFSEPEALELFREIASQSLDASLLGPLLEKTEGWVTGLQLVAQALAGRPSEEARTYIQSLHDCDTHVYDYLADEVFERQEPAVQEFLLATSVGERFCLELARELTGDPEVAGQLETLVRSRLFLVNLGEGWYRYHHLFGDFLRRRLESRALPERVRSLHLAVARAMAGRNEPAAAIPHFLKAESYEQAADLLESPELLTLGAPCRLREWLSRLPADLRARRPTLDVVQAELLDLEGNWAEAVELYRTAIRAYRLAGEGEAMVAALEKLSLCYLKYGDTERLMQTCEDGLALCGPSDNAMRSILGSLLGATLVYSGRDFERGYFLMAESHALAWACSHPRAISWACLAYGFAYHFPQGNFSEALAVLGEGIEFFRRKNWALVCYQLAMNKALVLIMAGQLSTAGELVEDVWVNANRAGHVYVAKGFENLRAMVCLERYELAQAARMLASISENHVPAQFKPWYYRNRMLLSLLSGATEQARVAGEAMLRVLDLNGYGLYAAECLCALGYLELRSGKLEHSARYLERALGLAADARSSYWEMKAHMVLAAAQPGPGPGPSLERALTLTREHGYEDFWRSDPWRLSVGLLLQATELAEHRQYAIGILLSMGDCVLDQIEPVLDEPRYTLRRQAAVLLGSLSSPRAERILRRLVQGDPARTVREAAGYALQRSSGSIGSVSIRAFGGLEIVADGVPQKLTDLKRSLLAQLLKYILCSRDLTIVTDQALECFWPDYPADRSRHSLAQHVSLLRRMFRGVAGDRIELERTATGYRLDLNGLVDYDVMEFERLAQEGWEAGKHGDSERATARMLRAERLYTADFLAHDLYLDFISERRQELRDRFRELLAFLAEEDRREGRPGEAVVRYRRLLALEPLDQKASERMLECLSHLGDHAGWLRESERFRRAWLETTGLEPPETAAVYRRPVSVN